MKGYVINMKKKFNILLAIVSILFLIGCTNNGQTDSEKPNENKTPDVINNNNSYTLSDFYPFVENRKYAYDGGGMEYASFTIQVDFVKDNKIQIRKNNGGTETVNVIQLKDGELKVIFTRNECYYRENFLSKMENSNEILLKEPLIKGTAWTLSDGRKRYISNTDVEISTPAGIYKTIEVTTEDSKSKTIDYYGLNVGLIKTIYKSEGSEVSSSLSKIEKDSPLVQKVNFYYPNIDDDKLYYTERSLSFNTNDLTKLYFENEFKKSPSEKLGKLLGANAKINSLYLNDDGMVYLDLSENFVSEMNAGSGYEVMILQSITNTLGNYYGVDKVYITVGEKPYSSGHIFKEKGEYFTVNTSKSVELPK
jgi:Sporulation and spore germination